MTDAMTHDDVAEAAGAASAPAWPLVHLAVEDEAWEALPGAQALIARAAAAAFAGAGVAAEGWAVSALLTSDAEVAELNQAHRGKAGPTNVLSWPAYDLAPETPGEKPFDPGAPEPHPGEAAEEIGDLALAYGVCAREAEEGGLSLSDHVLHLALHGVLHCLGYDHISDEDASVMEGIETAILTGMGLNDPYRAALD